MTGKHVLYFAFSALGCFILSTLLKLKMLKEQQDWIFTTDFNDITFF